MLMIEEAFAIIIIFVVAGLLLHLKRTARYPNGIIMLMAIWIVFFIVLLAVGICQRIMIKI